MEEFRDIKGYEGLYQVSNMGRVKGLSHYKTYKDGREPLLLKERFKKPVKLNTGYLSVILYNKGRNKTFTVHQLVAMAFLDHTPCGMTKVVDHINGIKSDNRLSNLQLISQRENCSKDKKGYASQYIGVHWRKDRNTWISRIRINGKLKYLGSFKEEEEAAKAYQEALKSLHTTPK